MNSLLLMVEKHTFENYPKQKNDILYETKDNTSSIYNVNMIVKLLYKKIREIKITKQIY